MFSGRSINMEVIKIYPRGVGSNAYILTADGENAVVIDPSDENIAYELEKRALICRCALLTHGHFDHVGGCGKLYEQGVEIYCGEYEKDLIFSPEYLKMSDYAKVPFFEITRTLKDNEILDIFGMKITAMHTPGHSSGSVCYLVNDCLFTGDTLFKGSIGRFDFPSGDYGKLVDSLLRIKCLPGDYELFCGHGLATTLNEERASNVFVKGLI